MKLKVKLQKKNYIKASKNFNKKMNHFFYYINALKSENFSKSNGI